MEMRMHDSLSGAWRRRYRVALAVASALGGALAVSSGHVSDAAGATSPNPCALLTKPQVQSILKTPVANAARTGTICTFKTAPVNGGSGSFVLVTILKPYSPSQFHSDYLAAIRRAQYKLVSGIGNQAVFRATQSEIDARKGNALVSIVVDVLNAQGLSVPQPLGVVKPLARSALSKL